MVLMALVMPMGTMNRAMNTRNATRNKALFSSFFPVIICFCRKASLFSSKDAMFSPLDRSE